MRASLLRRDAGRGGLPGRGGQAVDSVERGTPTIPVPYKGAAAALTDLMDGQIGRDVHDRPYGAAVYRVGQLRAIGVTGAFRDALRHPVLVVRALPARVTPARYLQSVPTTLARPWHVQR